MKKFLFLAVLTLAACLPAASAQASHWGLSLGINVPFGHVYYGHPYGRPYAPYYRNYYYSRPYDYYYYGPDCYSGPYYRPYYTYPRPGYRYYYDNPRYRPYRGPRYYRR